MEKKVVYRELSYQVVGILFEVYNELGAGYKEKYYENAVAEVFTEQGVNFKRQIYHPLKFRDKIIGKHFFDFLVEDKIILELKAGTNFSHKHFQQVNDYLQTSGKQLAILANFTNEGVKYRRVVNLESHHRTD